VPAGESTRTRAFATGFPFSSTTRPRTAAPRTMVTLRVVSTVRSGGRSKGSAAKPRPRSQMRGKHAPSMRRTPFSSAVRFRSWENRVDPTTPARGRRLSASRIVRAMGAGFRTVSSHSVVSPATTSIFCGALA